MLVRLNVLIGSISDVPIWIGRHNLIGSLDRTLPLSGAHRETEQERNTCCQTCLHLHAELQTGDESHSPAKSRHAQPDWHRRCSHTQTSLIYWTHLAQISNEVYAPMNGHTRRLIMEAELHKLHLYCLHSVRSLLALQQRSGGLSGEIPLLLWQGY